MKKQFIFAAALFAATVMVGCQDTDPTIDPDPDPESEVVLLSGTIEEDFEIAANTTCSLDGAFIVKSGATLTIGAGAQIIAVDDDVDDYILIEQGAQIYAVGTATNPIVMTSEKKSSGAWGGLHICGYAQTNVGTGLSEIGNATYGGNDDTDNSGTLKYIRLEYTGFVLNEEQESNGVTFYAVGNGTTVSHLQAYRGADDGFEFFGGSVNVKYLVATSCKDDSFDWTEGWRGKGQYLIAYHEEEGDLGYVCDCLLEADNNGDNADATPCSKPILSNLTLVGNNSATKLNGVHLKAGTQVELYNTIITGKSSAITTKTTQTETSLLNGESLLMSISTDGDITSETGGYSTADFMVEANGNDMLFVNTLENNYYGVYTGGVAVADSFFDATDYQGALDASNDWTAGWVKTAESVDSEIITLSGSITSDFEIPAFSTCILDGAYVVKSGATLTIGEGVLIAAIDDEVDDYILIEQGAQIYAVGTATNPIVMTSEKKSSGAWGGLHICGYAQTNVGTGLSEIGNATYGGDNDADNSGTLKYIRLEYTGFVLNEEQESNGVTFYAVGNGTTVSHLQAYRGADDGFEFFGGCVDVKYLVATSCKDDSFDWTEGWRGRGQYLIAYHEEEADLGYVCDCLLEADNNGDNADALPCSKPVLSNLTLVGNNSATKLNGVHLKAGTQVELYNTIITGKSSAITTKTTQTETSLLNGESLLMNISTDGVITSETGGYSTADFIADANNNDMSYSNSLTDNYYGIISGSFFTLTDSFFETAEYQGALDASNDWTAGWVL